MKKFTTGLLAGIMLTSSVTVFAANGRMIEVFDNVKRVVVNNVEKPFDKNNAPFVYNGTTYVPLKFVADTLGEAVSWDGKTGTVFIGETSNKNAHYFSTNINHSVWDDYYSKYSYSNGKPSNIVTSNMGNKYSNYLTLNVPTAYRYYGELTFPLNGQYSSFNGILGCTNKYTSGKSNIKLTILLDGREVYNKNISTGMLEEPIVINTKGALNITFKAQGNDEKEGHLELGIFNGEFIK